ncbi:hypothetical protein [Ruminococcus sp.]|uniref:hypothetical protein n=1 Tax=Ruminococcus sp. TaxID=41978 RepID=UPI002584A6D7|nr:hypothetical protein [Ruminococcus sp.]
MSIADAPVIFIDQRKKRIRIHRTTLKMLGDPKYIQLLIDPNRTVLVIRRCDKSSQLALKLPNSKSQCCELYSTNLVDLFYDICSKWDESSQYRLIGKLNKDNSFAYFRMQDSNKISDTEVTDDESYTSNSTN